MNRRRALALLAAAPLAAAESRPDGTTALHDAAEAADLPAARRLLAAGAPVNARNRYGVTPLSLAAATGDQAIVALLLSSGADANAALPGGETPLMTAARTGPPGPVRALLTAGADPNAKEETRGQTALMWAAAEGHTESLGLLLAAGADLHARLASGFTPLLFAVRQGQTGAVNALLAAGASPRETVEGNGKGRAPRPGSSALHLAAANAHFSLGARLLEAGADPNAIGPGWAPLHTVTWVRKPGGGDNDPAPQGSGPMSSLEFVSALAARGANLNLRMTKKVNVGLTSLNTTGATPFLLAARTADAELMRHLARLGADPKIPNADGATAIIVAAGLGTRSPGEDAGTEEEVVEALETALSLGLDINAVDRHGETAMHGAAYKNLPGAVRFLAAHGARREVWDQKNEYGWTPLTIAEGHRFGNFKPSPVTVAAIREALGR